MQPNDRQLVELVRELPAAGLAPGQIEILWQRFVDSPELRDELLRESPGAEYLREAFGRLEFPVDEYLTNPPATDQAHAAAPVAQAAGSPSKGADPPILVHISWLPILPLLLAVLFVPLIELVLLFRTWPGEPPAPAESRPDAVRRQGRSQCGAAAPGKNRAHIAADSLITDVATTAEPTGANTPPGRATPSSTGEPAAERAAPPQSDRAGDLPMTRGHSPDAVRGVEPNRAVAEPAEHPDDDETGGTAAAPASPDDAATAVAADRPALIISDDPSHPLTIELNKEGYNVWVELKASLDEQAYSDVLRTMRLTPHGAHLGLLPDPVDKDLFLPFGSLLAAAMRDHPELLDEMRAEFGPVAQVRLAAAMADCDVRGVESVAVQFYGTEAAAGAHRWLGDRALSGGSFPKAVRHYHRALAFGFAGDEADLNARLRLAGAMQGLDLGRPVVEPVALGDVQMPASEFEALVQQQRAGHAEPPAAAPDLLLPPSEIPPAPAPAPQQLRRWAAVPVGARGWGQFDDDLRKNANDFDWAACCLSASPAGRLVIVSNRQQVAGFDLMTGQRKWYQEFDNSSGYPPTWNWVPMPPLILGDRIFTRRLPRLSGPELVCLDRQTGRVLWTACPGDHVASQPVWHRAALVAVTASSNEPTIPAAPVRRRLKTKDRVFQLHLTSFDPTSGAVLTQVPWVHLRDQWYGTLPCRTTTDGDDLVVTAGGIVLYADLEGEIHWVRRQPYRSKEDDLIPPQDRYHSPPLIDAERIFAYQPGARAIECLDRESGRRIWQRAVPDTKRMVALAAGHLVVQADSHLIGLRCDDGSAAWEHQPNDSAQAFLGGGPGGLAYVDCVTLPSGDWQLDLVWLDPQTGNLVQRQRLTEFSRRVRRDWFPHAGPFFRIADRLFLGISPQSSRPTDREFYELVPAG